MLAPQFFPVNVSDKSPKVQWLEFDEGLSYDDAVAKWASEGTGLAMKLGESYGFVDLEADGFQAERELAKRLAKADLPKHPTWASQRGTHNLFRVGTEAVERLRRVDIKDKGVHGVDLLGTAKAQYTILPPSGVRKWTNSLRPADAPELTVDMVDRLFGDWMADEKPDDAGPVSVDLDAPWWQYNLQPNVRDITLDLLIEAGWTLVNDRNDSIVRLKRPVLTEQPSDKPHNATFGFNKNISLDVPYFYNFSSSVDCEPFEEQRSYQPFDVYKLLVHGGDHRAAIAAFSNEQYDIVDEFDDAPEPTYDYKAAAKNGSESVTQLIEAAAPPEPPKPPASKPEPGDGFYNNILGQYALEICALPGVEADPAAVMLQAFEWFGNAMGTHAFIDMGGRKVFANGYLFVVGEAAKGRKGTSYNYARMVFDEAVFGLREVGGTINSGEGLVEAMAKRQKLKAEESMLEPQDVPYTDLIAFSSEVAGTLSKMGIENSTLTANLNAAWDGDAISNMKAKDSVTVYRPLLSIIGHIQPEVLKKTLTDAMLHSGFLSRVNFIYTERTRLDLSTSDNDRGVADEYREFISTAIMAARKHEHRRIGVSDEAQGLFNDLYVSTGGEGRDHTHRAKTALRLCLMRGGKEVSAEDVRQALAIERYYAASREFCMGDWGPGADASDNELKVIGLMEANGTVNKADLFRAFSGNIRARGLDDLLAGMIARGLIVKVTESRKPNSKGRPKQAYRLA